eukprot:9522840-Karenia_brevis.AAC.1
MRYEPLPIGLKTNLSPDFLFKMTLSSSLGRNTTWLPLFYYSVDSQQGLGDISYLKIQHHTL